MPRKTKKTSIDSQSNPPPRPKVLVIDDDSFITGIYTLTLTNEGFDVVLAKNGLEGIALAKKIMPHIILLDLVMPGIDGFETLERIKREEKLKPIPVVILSGLSQPEDIDRALHLGAVSYLRKTQTLPGDCLAKIREILRI